MSDDQQTTVRQNPLSADAIRAIVTCDLSNADAAALYGCKPVTIRKIRAEQRRAARQEEPPHA